jgi:hypothetical protein
MENRIMILNIVTGSLFVGLALLHLYWAAGGLWPGRDMETLARTVVGGPAGMQMPGPLACVVVAALLGLSAAFVFAAVRVPMIGVATVLVARGVYGFFELRYRPVIRGSRYARLNVQLYSPFALALGIMTALSATTS